MEWIIDERKRVGRKDVLIGYLEDSGVVKSAHVTIAHDAQPTPQDLLTAWETGTVIPGGAKLWRQLQLRDADENNRDVINAILDVVRANGTLAQMITAGETAIADNTRQQAFYNRLTTALNNGTAAERWKFLALLSVISFSKIGQR